ncbi:lysozyme inhibitor LprI family protein [Sphingomonas taxi]|jgi:uncharacterized protein YecT (DUF1311 family)|uniref:lysozyme inhibitor LprI family protein n=1 Tax=Sphingomonas taxi TaxID=1549858 RepID=UPI00068C05E7|nr:lysozyme inhibitor LprI family protein [Sphingomonas taxi]
MLLLAFALVASGELDRCLNTGEAARGVTTDMAACFVADFERADATLNVTYAKTMKRLPASRQAALRASQRAWIAQRDRACPLDNSPGAGTIERLNHPGCLARQTRRRITWLSRYR